MSDFTQVNLKDDVENASEKFGLAPNMEARFARNAMGLEGGGFSYQRLAPNFRGPFGHRHERQEEVYVVVSGGARIKVGADVHDLRQWDAVRLAPAAARAFEAGPDGLELIAIGFGDGGDAEVLQEFWTD
jgi:hypothetical protein